MRTNQWIFGIARAKRGVTRARVESSLSLQAAAFQVAQPGAPPRPIVATPVNDWPPGQRAQMAPWRRCWCRWSAPSCGSRGDLDRDRRAVGLAPALRASRPSLTSALTDDVYVPDESGRWLNLRKALVVAEIALSLVLLLRRASSCRASGARPRSIPAVPPATC